jgi:hypothetical protein
MLTSDHDDPSIAIKVEFEMSVVDQLHTYGKLPYVVLPWRIRWQAPDNQHE